ncbi:MAG: hypothetical protein ACI8P3_003855 [Saprospiraceae bacterium]|jgi:hypothetical protein
MKILLSFGLAVLVYMGFDFGLTKQVDYTGVYYALSANPKIVSSQLSLKEDGNFEYYIASVDAMLTPPILKGEYKVKGNQLQLFPASFKTCPGHNRQIGKGTKIKIQCQFAPNIIDYKSPSLFKQSLASFESGASRLKPKYYIKQLKNQLSLCVLDLKTEQYSPQFTQFKK